MKKYSLLLFLVTFLLSGCSISYSTNINGGGNIQDSGSSNEGNGNSNNGGNNGETPPPSGDNGSDNQGDSGNSNVLTPNLSAINNPDIAAPSTINDSALFYPSYLNASSSIILQHSYVDDTKTGQYKVYSAYYSSYYDTLYIAYDSVTNPVQTITAKDLYQMERHAINYFVTDNNKTDYKNYLKAVLVYPDTLASSCRKGLTDNSSISINGCANYVGKEAVISLNRMSELAHFYEERKIPASGTTYYQVEAMRFTFAHEFGHVSTFYNMAHQSDENYEDYLKLRLGDLYSTIYPNGLPTSYSSQNTGYYTQPSEILADDYVELFYDRSQKVSEDTYSYTLDKNYDRNSLKDYSSIKDLETNETLYTVLRTYYINYFLDNSSRVTYTTPKIMSLPSNARQIEYYESVSKIGSSKKTISTSSEVHLIAVGEITVNSVKYYRVILSNTFNALSSGSYDEKEAGKKMGYVKASDYTRNTQLKLYKIDNNLSQNTKMTKYQMAPIEQHSNIFVLPYYDFSYVLNKSTSTNYATMYDYLNTKISGQTYKINIYSFGTLLN